MRVFICGLLFLFPLTSISWESGELNVSRECDYDRSLMLGLDYRAFDQTVGGGWRSLSAKGCDLEAADLVRDYRMMHESGKRLIFHEAQLRAFAGQTKEAIELFRKTYIAPGTADPLGFNLYVKATIAFLEEDRKTLLATAEDYFNFPKPESLKLVDAEGNPVNMGWPVNKFVVTNLIKCFDKDYRYAYKKCGAS